jgi:hypothetical protein
LAAGRYTPADTVYPWRTVVGLDDAGHTTASLPSDEPHGHGLPVHDHVTNCELSETAYVVNAGCTAKNDSANPKTPKR